MENKNNIVVNESKGYGYNYASLSDIAKQGYIIPKMKVDTDQLTFKEYVYYFDNDLNEWMRGAEIVIPENIVNKDGKNKMNSAQLYGSALTYARRYTTLMALQLTCDDDKNIENIEEDTSKKIQKVQKDMIIANGNLISEELKKLGVRVQKDIDKLTIEQASELCRLIGDRSDEYN